jgi:hypothetical protein
MSPRTSEQILRQQAQDATPRQPSAQQTGFSDPPNGFGDPISDPLESKALTPTRQQLPATNNKSAVDEYLDRINPNTFFGSRVKFDLKTGTYPVGKVIEGQPPRVIDQNVLHVALMHGTLVGHVKFVRDEFGKVRVISKMGELFGDPPFVPLLRNALGDLDESEWETGLDGRPQDPWTEVVYIPCQAIETAEPYTIVCSTTTSRSAAGALIRHYQRMLKSFPEHVPTFKFGVSGFPHRDKRVGWVKTPIFVLIGRIAEDQISPAAAVDDLRDGDDIPF